MANLRGGVESDRRNGSTATRLATGRIHAWVNTWTRTVSVHLDKNGRTSITVSDDDKHVTEMVIELPANEGEQEAFVPKISYRGTDLTTELTAIRLAKPIPAFGG